MASSKNLTLATLHGISWSTVATITTLVMQVGYTAVMARLLTPTDFGLVALSAVVLRFGTYFAQMGLEQALVQKPDLTEEDVRTTFTTAVVLGTLSTVVLTAAAPLALYFFDEPAVVPLLRLTSLSLFLTGVSATAVSILRRQMAFRTLSLMNIVSYILGYGGVGVVMAWQGFGASSLIGAGLGQGVISGIIAYAATRHPIRPYFKWSHYRPLLMYGGSISITSFIEFITSSLDTMVIGRLLGATMLGIYNRAWMLVTLPLFLLTNSVSRVIFPAFSKVQADVDKMRMVYMASVTLVAAGVLPVCAGVAVAAPELVRSLLGPGWEAAVPLLRVMCAAVPLSLITMFAGIVCDARATLRQKINLNLLALGSLVLLFGLLQGYGLLGFTWALVLNELVRTALYLRQMHTDLTAPYARLLGMYVPGLFHAAVVGGGLGLVSYGLHQLAWPAPLALAALMLTGAVVLGGLALALPLPQLRQALYDLLSRLDLANASGRIPRLLYRYTHFLTRTRQAAPAVFHNPATPVLP
jgi:lipopolysaccharide exporter